MGALGEGAVNKWLEEDAEMEEELKQEQRTTSLATSSNITPITSTDISEKCYIYE